MQPARHSKLEKADILEMTVKHLQSLQRQQLAVAVTTDPQVLSKFKTGFSECATEVNRYISNMDGVETGVKQRLVAHLSGCVTGLQQVSSTFSYPGVSSTTNASNIPLTITQNNSGAMSIQTGSFSGDVNNNNNNTRIQIPAGVQLIPSRLPTGELALLVPNSSNIPFFNAPVMSGNNFTNTSASTESNIPSHRSSTSAFTTVRPSRNDTYKMKMSPPLSPASSTTSYEEPHMAESFPRPRTPSPREVTISFPTPPGPSHPSAFKTTFKQDISPPQHLQVTSTSVSPENKPNALKIEYKTVPIYQPNEKRDTSHYRTQKSLEPLSVITSDRFKSTPKETLEDNTFFRKKRPFPEDPIPTEGLLTVATFEPQSSARKYARYTDDVSITSSSSLSGSPEQRFAAEFQHKPSTSGVNQPENNDSMWRPW